MTYAEATLTVHFELQLSLTICELKKAAEEARLKEEQEAKAKLEREAAEEGKVKAGQENEAKAKEEKADSGADKIAASETVQEDVVGAKEEIKT